LSIPLHFVTAGRVFRLTGFPLAPLAIGLVPGPQFEQTLRRIASERRQPPGYLHRRAAGADPVPLHGRRAARRRLQDSETK
jgi:hypothetical protein